MQIKINGKEYEARAGEMIYGVARRNGIKIPTLCSTKEVQTGVCRVCLVEINGRLMTSCNTEVQEGMEIVTDTKDAEKARRINLELLWADHAGKCATCKKNRMCELQKLAEEFKLENFHFVPRKNEMTSAEELALVKDNWSRVVTENENPCVSRTSEFCVECRRCINVCPEKKFAFNHRAGDVVVGTPYNEVLDCSFCGACVESCPVAALTDQNDHKKIMVELESLKKLAVAVVDVDMEKKILEKIKNISPEKNLDKILTALGFERIINLNKKDSGKESEVFENIKTTSAKKEKIDPENIVTFFISSQIAMKKNKNKFLDYVLSEREVARIVRDKGKDRS